MRLQSPIAELKGIGPKSAQKFQQLGLTTVEDLLLYFPFRYEDFQNKSIFDLQDGEKAVITGTVVTPPNVQYYGFKRNRLTFKLKQGEFVIAVSFFNQPYLQDKVALNQDIAVFGKWDQRKTALTGLKLLLAVEEELQPVYHVIQGVSQQALIKAIKAAFATDALSQLTENLPAVLLQRYRLLPRQAAISAMHFPKDLKDYQQALRRIKFEELFYFQMRLQLLKASQKDQSNGLQLSYDPIALQDKLAALPFTLTPAQQTSLAEILADLSSAAHMNRLLQGDVGSGKTVIASLAMYAAYTAGFQSALMVPTEILAEQHYESLHQLFPELSIAIVTSGMKAGEKRAAQAAISSGEVAMIVGTHALIQEGLTYHRLGLVITDEQHRFGVKQRRIFREKGENPDVLMMTATPIPRTLAITAYGEMDVSVIDQLPAGRKPIITRWVKHQQLETVLDWVAGKITTGAQVYVISPLIEESEALDLKNAVALEAELKDYFQDRARIALMHGKMKNDEKDHIMQAFKNHEIDVLVSTTVIEVGVNVPNATIIIIMDADRFGLSQLHQLRGRVGRGEKQSYAILVANPKTESGKERMTLMTQTTDGFALAQADLKMRGSGEIFGTRQSGLPEFKSADIVEDYPILEEARRVASQIVADPNWQKDPQWQSLVKELTTEHVLD
ncbi:ATP-dependent DNA helicase RecG [Streptococcus halichoeri]|uniref:ATP-dependent DNA helicase RecG n=1 Tax=Streptococcus halichoeri TaxID=254785 RepID=UPI001358A8CE|nr:ATP-dependent DNA helicase RecG [Streptococcus halichoeri]